MSLESKTKLEFLRDRASMLKEVRRFFDEKGYIEVDTDILSETAPVSTHIDVMSVEMGNGKTGYLHTSPEYGMKKLLSQGSGDIYQLGHVFRAGEEGPRHSLEFTMLEWYRTEMAYLPFIEETLDLIRLVVGNHPSETYSYYEAFRHFAELDILKVENLYECALSSGLHLSPEASDWDRDTFLNLLFTHLVEPHLGQGVLTVIHQYPASQAALAKTSFVNGIEVASRFEIYFKGIELANGYDELTDAKEQRRRFIEDNLKRLEMGKESLPIDEEFLTALEKGLPDCRGVAVGFDRLIMIRQGLETLKP